MSKTDTRGGRKQSLDTARQRGTLRQFARGHPVKGDRRLFDALLERMATGGRGGRLR